MIVKKGVDEVFGDENYKRHFPNRSTVARRFVRIFLSYRVCKFLEVYGYGNVREWRKLRHCFWNTLWAFHTGILANLKRSEMTPDSIGRAFEEMERRGKLGKKAQAAARRSVRVVWQTWRKARKRDPERWTANNFFKSVYGMKMIQRHALSRISNDVRVLATTLSNYK